MEVMRYGSEYKIEKEQRCEDRRAFTIFARSDKEIC
jgi:hypothetical protein